MRGVLSPFGLASPFSRDTWAPLALFSDGAQGAWYDPSDLSTMFQDSGGTTPVTAAGDPVGLIMDKSGNGNHASQPTAGFRPLLQNDGNWYLDFDGTDDILETAAVDFTSSDEMSAFAGVMKDSDAAIGSIIGTGTLDGSFELVGPHAASSGSFQARSRGTVTKVATAFGYPSPVASVLSATFDISAPLINFRIDGSEVANITTDQGTGNYGNHVLAIGSRSGGTQPFDGRVYQSVVVGKVASSSEISATEGYISRKTGVQI